MLCLHSWRLYLFCIMYHVFSFQEEIAHRSRVWGHVIRGAIYTCRNSEAPQEIPQSQGRALGAGLCWSRDLDGLWYWPWGSLLCEMWEGVLCMRQCWPKPRCCGQWQKWSWLQLLCSVLSLDSLGGGCWIQSAVLLFHSISPPLCAVGSPFLPGIINSCDLCTNFLDIPRCISLLLPFLLSDLIVFFMALIEDEGMGKIFREGSFQLDMHCTSFPGRGNGRLVVDLQKLLGLEKGVGSMENCFWSKGRASFWTQGHLRTRWHNWGKLVLVGWGGTLEGNSVRSGWLDSDFLLSLS